MDRPFGICLTPEELKYLAQILEIQEGSILILTVKDNGRGFWPDDVSAERNGLSSMRRRVETLGGELTVSSRTGAGTTISARVRID